MTLSRTPRSLELLEARIAPAALLGLDKANHLYRFDSASPELITASVTLTGLQPGEQMVGIDFAPDSGYLFGLGLTDGGGSDDVVARVYQINAITGAAVVKGTVASDLPEGARWSIDFDPRSQGLRVVSSLDHNFLVAAFSGTIVSSDTPLNDPAGTEELAGIAYSQNDIGAVPSTLYGIDRANGNLVRVGGSGGSPAASTGVVTPLGSLGVPLGSTEVGFDITSTGAVLASLPDSSTGLTSLYTIDVGTGAAARVGQIGAGGPLNDIAAVIFSWSGEGANDSWSNPANWTAGVDPKAGDSLLFRLVTDRLTSKNDLPAGTVFHSIQFADQFFTLTGNALTLTNGIIANGSTPDSFNTLSVPVSFAQDTTITSLQGEVFFSSFSALDLQGHTLTIDGAGAVYINAPLLSSTGAGALIKSGAGKLTLAGNDTGFAGPTTLLAGGLEIYGDHSTSSLTISGGTLTGRTDVVQGNLGLGPVTATAGTVRPGENGVDTLAAGPLTLGAGVIFSPTLNATQGTTVVGRLQVTGAVTLGGSTLQLNLPSALPDGSIHTLISNDGTDAVSGTFANLAEGATISINGVDYTLSYQGGDGNDVVLSRGEPIGVNGSGNLVTFTDADGDLVTVKVSRGVLVSSNFHLQAAGVLGGAQLERLILTGDFAGSDVTITARPQRLSDGKMHGDGLVNVGSIESAGDLRKVVVNGDLGQIDAGDANTRTPAIASLTVDSLGRYDASTQGANPSVRSELRGPLGALVVKHDMIVATISVTGGDDDANGKIGSIFIGGSLIGSVGFESGSIIATGNIGAVQIGGDISGNGGEWSGSIDAGGNLKSLTLGGNVVGAQGKSSGVISIGGSAGPIVVAGSVYGARGEDSGGVAVFGFASSVQVKGSVFGGAGAFSGQLYFDTSAGKITLGGDLEGGPGTGSGQVKVAQDLNQVVVGGSLHGGAGERSGSIIVANLRQTATIKGSLVGGAGNGSGALNASGLLNVATIAGSILGGEGSDSGKVVSGGALNSLTLGGHLFGGDGMDSGSIAGGGAVKSIAIKGSVTGGDGESSGSIEGVNFGIKSLRIGGNLEGGAGGGSGSVLVSDKLDSLRIDGSIRGGDGAYSAVVQPFGVLGKVQIGGDIRGGAGDHSAGILARDNLTSATVAGSVVGGSGPYSGYVYSQETLNKVTVLGELRGGSGLGSGRIGALGRLESVTVGSISGGTARGTGSINSNDSIGSILVKRDVSNGPFPVTFTAQSTQEHPVAIEKVDIMGSAYGVQILGGYINFNGPVAVQGNASLGKIHVRGQFLSSTIAAGIDAGPDKSFGTADDVAIDGTGVSRIASIIIDQSVRGTRPLVSLNDHFGFVADEIAMVQIRGQRLELTAGPNNDTTPIELGTTGDVSVRELAPTP